MSARVSPVVLALLCSLTIARADEPPPPALKLVQTIPLDGVEGRMDHFGADPQRKRLYLAALGNDSLEVIDTEAGRRITSIKGLKKPTGVCVTPAGHVIAASGEDGKVRVFDVNLKPLGTIDGLEDADNVRLDPAGKIAYAGYGDGALAAIDVDQIRKTDNVKLAGHPEAFQLEQNGPLVFVNVPTAHHIAVVDREKLKVIAKWPVKEAEANFPMALDEANHRLFVGCRKPAKVLVIDTETGKTVAAIDCCGDADDLFYDGSSKRVYVSGGEGYITVIQQTDADHSAATDKIPTAAGARTSYFDPAASRLYLAVPHRGDQAAELRVYATGEAAKS